MPSIDIDKTLAVLTQDRETLLHQLAELGADERGEFTGDMTYSDAFADAGASTAERTETMGIVDNLKNRLDKIDAAISRLDEGSFGVCTQCGKDIGPDRIEYRPTSSKCIDCKTSSV